GYSSRIIEVPENRLPELCHFGTGPRPSVIGLKGNGKLKITLNGHYDVVPAGTGWKTDPFKPLISNSYLYGRGSSDMKGGLAMQIYAIKLLENTVGQIFDKISIMQTAVPDEETVGNKNAGMYYLMESKIISRENTDFVIFTEPLGVDNICYGHRGAIFITVKVFGRKSHGSMAYLGKDAISGAVDLIT
ncbi:succinyl-diaminopimelate desuccinylase, partial [Acidiplasma aeolicum]